LDRQRFVLGEFVMKDFSQVEHVHCLPAGGAFVEVVCLVLRLTA
jgi:hypothetical protein